MIAKIYATLKGENFGNFELKFSFLFFSFSPLKLGEISGFKKRKKRKEAKERKREKQSFFSAF